MKKSLLAATAFLLLCAVANAQLTVTNLLTENRENPFGIDNTQPRFSWQLSGSKRNIQQAAYEIKVTNDKTVVWSSGKIASSQSVFVAYAGAALQPNKKYNWQVKVWSADGSAAAWSKPAFFKMGLLTRPTGKQNG